MTSITPVVAIVGRPNVGKSTLFNRLVRERRSIVHDQPGVTRDRVVATAPLTGGPTVRWIDTGGLVPGEPSGINDQVLLAVEACDVALLVVDGADGVTPADQRVLEVLRPLVDEILLVVNKSDRREAREGAGDFWRLGVGEPCLVSAEHGAGLVELEERLLAMLPAADAAAPAADEAIAVAIVGRPNVGKSSLLNRIAGEDRALVSPLPGTTRDPIDSLVRRDEQTFRLVDTAGIRRRSRVSGAPEELAVMLARRQIERAEVAVLVLEAPAGVTSGDLAVAGAIWEAGRAAVVAINKWDLLDDEGRERLDRSWPRLAELLADPPRLNVSATTGRGIEKLFDLVVSARRCFRTEVSTGELNRMLERTIRQHRPPSFAGRPWKLLYATQVSTGPPTFILFANRKLPQEHPYRRYLENRLREQLGIPGCPLRLVVRTRSTRGAKTS